MELHESLYALGLSQGREVFNDADSFRGALDDYLDEDSASTGDINLLVDAVRLGAFQSMTTMLDSGAASDRAVAEAGARLARDRGSADVGGAQWALAVLGYAIGRVSDDQVRRYRTQHVSAPIPQGGGAPTALPPQGFGAPAATQRPAVSPPQPAPGPAWPNSGGQAPPPAAAGSGGVPSYGPPGPGFASVPSGAPPRKRGPLLGILIGLIALIVVVGVVIVVVVVSGGDDSPKNDEPTADDRKPAVDLSPEAINERYSSLGTSLAVGAGITSCTAADSLAAGEQEKLECEAKDGKLELTTYDAASDIDAVRTRVVNYDEGQLSNSVDSGYFYLYDPSNADDPRSDVPELYWDSKAALQTGQFTANKGVKADQLISTWKATTPTVDEPTDVYSPDLEQFVQRFKILRCDRIPTLYPGELEESQCNHRGNPVWVATFKDPKDFRDYRALAKRLARQDGNLVDQYWWKTEDPTQAEQGKIYGYIDDSGNGVLYADELDCLCYFQAYDDGEGDPEALRKTFFS